MVSLLESSLFASLTILHTSAQPLLLSHLAAGETHEAEALRPVGPSGTASTAAGVECPGGHPGRSSTETERLKVLD